MNKRLILWATLCVGAACSEQIEGSQYYPDGPCDGLDCTVTCDDEVCWSVSGVAPKADTDVQCDAILDHPDWELCDQTPSTCVSVFYDSAGCTAVCEAVGLVCSEVRENLDGTCAPNDERPPLSCSEPSGHQSDWCVCIDPNECVPDCTDRECGDDGCGGTCGDCTGTETCELGECLDQDPPRDERALLTERVGYGSKTTGGLDGTTCHVTNRNDSGAGSLRACTQTSGARWIVFDIDGAVYLKSNIQVPSNTTIDGRGRTVRIQGSGLNLSGVSNVLIVNLIFERGNGGDDNDAITIRNGTHNVWVHHCSFSDYGDGLIDIKEAATDITVSWSYFTNHDKVMLISASTKDTQDDVIRVTLHHNWFKNTKQRHPRLRFGRVHAFNNYFDAWGSYGIGCSYKGACRSEHNIFNADKNKSAIIHQVGEDSKKGSVRSDGDWLLNGARVSEHNRSSVFNPASAYSYSLDTAGSTLRSDIMKHAGWQ